MIGLKRGTVLLCDHCEEWETEANAMISKLKVVFGDAAVDIQHIGSTSIRTIKAKPIIDIAVGVRSFADLDRFLDSLLQIGVYKSSGQPFLDIVLFSRDDPDTGNRLNNIQVVLYGEEQWNKHILFRDYMNTYPEKACVYERLKVKAAELFPADVSAYSNYKSTLIEACIEEARSDKTIKECFLKEGERYEE